MLKIQRENHHVVGLGFGDAGPDAGIRPAGISSACRESGLVLDQSSPIPRSWIKVAHFLGAPCLQSLRTSSAAWLSRLRLRRRNFAQVRHFFRRKSTRVGTEEWR